MTRNVISFSLIDSPADVLAKLGEKQLAGGPVINPRGQVVGMITTWDFLVSPRFPDLIAMMTRAVRSLHRSDTISAAASIMFRERFNHLPVIDLEHKLMGIVTSFDLLKSIKSLSQLEKTIVTELALDPLQSLQRDELLPPARRLTQEDRDHLLVMDDSGPVGMITDGIFVRSQLGSSGNQLREQAVVASEVMAEASSWIGGNSSAAEAVAKMLELGVQQLAIVDGQRVHGLLRAREIVHHFCNTEKN